MKTIYDVLEKVKSWHNFLLIIAGFIVGIFTAGGYFQDFKNSARTLGDRVANLETGMKAAATNREMDKQEVNQKLDLMQQKFNENAIQFTEIRGRITGIEQNLSYQTRAVDKIDAAVSKLLERR